ncbi:hypothetical protein [Homoserinibacter sp. GY 40078]|uniref:hypothetical protein n=1 Tax=Homoserinibacter sp. GY 40078 TaxID=2603275 RepID=UPI0011C7871D|nr:hypothetical protein [Homoserinibacter sp. GY 40078]TXK19615.1 hypothetical protein FVQ89_07020 [Homoserinibacter sp. GY 40078]
MPRLLRWVRAATVVTAAAVLVACAPTTAPPDDAETPLPRDLRLAFACLADHSPWELDLDDAVHERADVASASGTAVLGTATRGRATMSFGADDDPAWSFHAIGVMLEVRYGDGALERAMLDGDLDARYDLEESGPGVLLLVRPDGGLSNTTAARGADGTPADPHLPAITLPWDGDAVVDIACTEHKLVISVPGGSPASWEFLPAS